MFLNQICPHPLGPLGRKWMESATNWDFSTFKVYNSAKLWSLVPNIKPDLDIYMLNLYTKIIFQLVLLLMKKVNLKCK